ncbi:hypothetical protein BRC93_16190 [Halobacteriales archaeon QS_5_70_15]|nr:MAG: hypothetical protein BRC93_16190 [Halobacteriales archaeon QS_5_70_15]
MCQETSRPPPEAYAVLSSKDRVRTYPEETAPSSACIDSRSDSCPSTYMSGRFGTVPRLSRIPSSSSSGRSTCGRFQNA